MLNLPVIFCPIFAQSYFAIGGHWHANVPVVCAHGLCGLLPYQSDLASRSCYQTVFTEKHVNLAETLFWDQKRATDLQYCIQVISPQAKEYRTHLDRHPF